MNKLHPIFKALKHTAVDPKTGCWEYTRSACIDVDGRAIRPRKAFLVMMGRDASGTAMADCGNTKCCNPIHTRIGKKKKPKIRGLAPIVRMLKRTKINAMSGCWEWQGSTTFQGYGTISVDGKHKYLHRLSYEMFTGAEPGIFMVCHHCDNPKCWNPAHIYLGDAKTNAADRKSRGRAPLDEYALRKMRVDMRMGVSIEELMAKYRRSEASIRRYSRIYSIEIYPRHKKCNF
jgi:hypothetical protein